MKKKGYEIPFFFLFGIDYTFKLDIIFCRKESERYDIRRIKKQ